VRLAGARDERDEPILMVTVNQKEDLGSWHGVIIRVVTLIVVVQAKLYARDVRTPIKKFLLGIVVHQTMTVRLGCVRGRV